MHDTRHGFTDIHRQFTGSDYSSALRDALLEKSGRTAFDLAFVIATPLQGGRPERPRPLFLKLLMIWPDVNDVDDARTNFMLVPAFCVRIRLCGACRGTYVLL